MGGVSAPRGRGRAVPSFVSRRRARSADSRIGDELVAGAPLDGRARTRFALTPMPPSIELPQRDRTLREFVVPEPRRWQSRSDPFTSRIAFAAAHVVSDPLAAVNPLS